MFWSSDELFIDLSCDNYVSSLSNIYFYRGHNIFLACVYCDLLKKLQHKYIEFSNCT